MDVPAALNVMAVPGSRPTRCSGLRRLALRVLSALLGTAGARTHQANIIGRFLEPERIAWKSFFGSWLSMPLTHEQRLGTPSQQQHIWQLGSYLPFSSFNTRSIDAPRRVIAYIDAFRQLHPHRLVAVDEMPYHEVRSQPLFHSWQIQHMGNPIAWEPWARQGRVRLQHLRDLILSGAPQTQLALQQAIALLLASMPPSWAAHVCGPSPQPTHMASAAPADNRVFCPDADGQLIHTHTVTATAALVPAPALEQDAPQAQLPADLRPVLVIDWDPTRPWHPRHSIAWACQHSLLTDLELTDRSAADMHAFAAAHELLFCAGIS